MLLILGTFSIDLKAFILEDSLVSSANIFLSIASRVTSVSFNVIGLFGIISRSCVCKAFSILLVVTDHEPDAIISTLASFCFRRLDGVLLGFAA